MADTADRRSEGTLSSKPANIAARIKYNEFMNKGLCKVCGLTEVRGRMTCYACTDDQKDKTYLSGLRYYLKKLEIDPIESIEFLDSLPWKTVEIDQLKALMELAKYAYKRY